MWHYESTVILASIRRSSCRCLGKYCVLFVLLKVIDVLRTGKITHKSVTQPTAWRTRSFHVVSISLQKSKAMHAALLHADVVAPPQRNWWNALQLPWKQFLKKSSAHGKDKACEQKWNSFESVCLLNGPRGLSAARLDAGMLHGSCSAEETAAQIKTTFSNVTHCRLGAALAGVRCFAFRHVLSTYVATSASAEASRRPFLTRATQRRVLLRGLPSLQFEPRIETDIRHVEKKPDRLPVSAKVMHRWPAHRAEIETSKKRKVPSAATTRNLKRMQVESSSFNLMISQRHHVPTCA